MQVGFASFAFYFISVLSGSVFAHNVPISKEYENERRTIDARRVRVPEFLCCRRMIWVLPSPFRAKWLSTSPCTL